MIQLPYKITTAKNPTRQSLFYFIPFIATFWACSFAFSQNTTNGTLIGFGSILLFIGVIVLVYKQDKKSKKTIELTSEGILEIKNKTSTYIGWEEDHQTYYNGTEFVYSGIFPIGSIVSTQVVAKGKRIKIDSIQNNFHSSILSLSHNCVFTLIQQQLEDDKRVYFGPIELDKESIYLKNKKFSRRDIEKIKVEKGKISLKLTSRWFATKMMVRDVPNFTSFIKLILSDINQS